jgi:glycosyltransferase involved in cell wall biosynthesis
MLVSVIVSVYDGRPYLVPALGSLTAQTHRELEIIVVDDASRDGTAGDLARLAREEPRLRVLTNPDNLGLARSLLRGLEAATGQIIARQDADDLSLPRRLERQAAALAAENGPALVGSGIYEMDQAGRRGRVSLQPSLPAVIRRKMLVDNAFFHPTVAWRREALERAGLSYDPGLRYAQDYDLFSRVLRAGLAAGNLREPLVAFRAHGGQVSRERAAQQQEAADAVAWANFACFGLAGEFSREQVGLLRRLGERARGLSPDQRRRQWELWRRLLARLEQGLGPAELSQWREMRRSRLGQLRRVLARPGLAPQLAACLAADPADAARDLARAAARRLGVRP